MNLRNGLASRNPLARRVRRHSRLSVLFRAPEAPALRKAEAHPAAREIPDSGPPRPAPVKALWLPGPLEAAPAAAAPVTAAGEPEAAGEQSIPVPTRERAPAAPAAPVQRAAETRPAPADVPPAPAQPAPAAPPVDETPPDEGIWRRLQNIYRKHEQKRDAAGEPDMPALAETPQAGPRRVETAPPVQPGSPPAQVIQAQPGDTEKLASPAVPGAGLGPVKAAPDAPLSPAAQAAPERPSGQGLSGPPPVEQTPSQLAAPAPVPDAPPAPAAKPPVQAVQRSPAAEAAPEPLIPDGDRGSGPEARELDLPRQAVPLQAAWPVQRQSLALPDRQPAVTEETRPPQPARPRPAAPAPDAAPRAAASFQAAGETARQVLDSVAPAQPSASTVEYVPPRQPRPVAQPLPPVAVAQPGEGHQPQPVENPSIFRRALEPPVEEAEEPTAVPTEIGPLPGDLWRLIGQPLPGPQGVEAEKPANQGAQTTAGASQPASPGPSASPPPAPPVVLQCQPAEPPAAPPPPDSRAGEAAPQDEQEAEIDLDDLTRQVWERVKRRLRIERERLGR